MFLLYINDTGDKISSLTTIKLFADDALLYRTINNPSDEQQLQNDLDTMIEWTNTWLMRFNASHLLKITRQWKPLQTQYDIEGRILEEVQHHLYLGVELTSDLTWKTHIANISGKANRIHNLLRRHLYGCSQEVRSRAITTLVHPTSSIRQYGTHTISKTVRHLKRSSRRRFRPTVNNIRTVSCRILSENGMLYLLTWCTPSL